MRGLREGIGFSMRFSEGSTQIPLPRNKTAQTDGVHVLLEALYDFPKRFVR